MATAAQQAVVDAQAAKAQMQREVAMLRSGQMEPQMPFGEREDLIRQKEGYYTYLDQMIVAAQAKAGFSASKAGENAPSYDPSYWQQRLATDRAGTEQQLAEMGVNPYPGNTYEYLAAENRRLIALGWAGQPATAFVAGSAILRDPRTQLEYGQFIELRVSPKVAGLQGLGAGMFSERRIFTPPENAGGYQGEGEPSSYSNEGGSWTVAPGVGGVNIGAYGQVGVTAGVRPTTAAGIPLGSSQFETIAASAKIGISGYGPGSKSFLDAINKGIAASFPGTSPANRAPYGTKSWFENEIFLRELEGKTSGDYTGLFGAMRSSAFVPYGEQRQTEIERLSKVIKTPSTGEIEIYQYLPPDIWTGKARGDIQIAGGGKGALESGMFSYYRAQTPWVTSQWQPEKLITGFAGMTGKTAAADVMARPDLFSRLGAEAYGGTVQPLDWKKGITPDMKVGVYPDNLFNMATAGAPGAVGKAPAVGELMGLPAPFRAGQGPVETTTSPTWMFSGKGIAAAAGTEQLFKRLKASEGTSEYEGILAGGISSGLIIQEGNQLKGRYPSLESYAQSARGFTEAGFGMGETLKSAGTPSLQKADWLETIPLLGGIFSMAGIKSGYRTEAYQLPLGLMVPKAGASKLTQELFTPAYAPGATIFESKGGVVSETPPTTKAGDWWAGVNKPFAEVVKARTSEPFTEVELKAGKSRQFGELKAGGFYGYLTDKGIISREPTLEKALYPLANIQEGIYERARNYPLELPALVATTWATVGGIEVLGAVGAAAAPTVSGWGAVGRGAVAAGSFAFKATPYVLGGAYTLSATGRATGGFEEFTPESVSSNIRAEGLGSEFLGIGFGLATYPYVRSGVSKVVSQFRSGIPEIQQNPMGRSFTQKISEKIFEVRTGKTNLGVRGGAGLESMPAEFSFGGVSEGSAFASPTPSIGARGSVLTGTVRPAGTSLVALKPEVIMKGTAYDIMATTSEYNPLKGIIETSISRDLIKLGGVKTTGVSQSERIVMSSDQLAAITGRTFSDFGGKAARLDIYKVSTEQNIYGGEYGKSYQFTIGKKIGIELPTTRVKGAEILGLTGETANVPGITTGRIAIAEEALKWGIRAKQTPMEITPLEISRSVMDVSSVAGANDIYLGTELGKSILGATRIVRAPKGYQFNKDMPDLIGHVGTHIQERATLDALARELPELGVKGFESRVQTPTEIKTLKAVQEKPVWNVNAEIEGLLFGEKAQHFGEEAGRLRRITVPPQDTFEMQLTKSIAKSGIQYTPPKRSAINPWAEVAKPRGGPKAIAAQKDPLAGLQGIAERMGAITSTVGKATSKTKAKARTGLVSKREGLYPSRGQRWGIEEEELVFPSKTALERTGLAERALQRPSQATTGILGMMIASGTAQRQRQASMQRNAFITPNLMQVSKQARRPGERTIPALRFDTLTGLGQGTRTVVTQRSDQLFRQEIGQTPKQGQKSWLDQVTRQEQTPRQITKQEPVTKPWTEPKWTETPKPPKPIIPIIPMPFAASGTSGGGGGRGRYKSPFREVIGITPMLGGRRIITRKKQITKRKKR